MLYEASVHASGLYIRAHNGRVAEGKEFEQAVLAFNAARARADYPLFEPADYKAAEPKLYAADIREMWVNGSDQDEKGTVTRDFRVPVTAKDLLVSQEP